MTFRPALILILLLATVDTARAAACEASVATIRRGIDTDVVLCGDALPDNISLNGLPEAQAEMNYMQTLGQCAVDDSRPGFHLVLTVNSPASQVKLSVQNTLSEERICELSLEVAAPLESPKPGWGNAMRAEAARFIDVKGIRTRYFESGEGSPLVLVHGGQAGGSNNSAKKWEQNFSGLAEDYRVIALDRLAQAGTENLPEAADYADYFARDAEHLEDFLEALQLTNVTLVGHSQGGWPVTRVSLNRPELVRCVVNVDTVMVPDEPKLMREALGFLMYNSRHLHPTNGPTFYSARRGMQLRYPSGNNITAAKAQRVVDQYKAPATREAAAQMAALRMTPLHPGFRSAKVQAYEDIAAGRLKTKSLVVWGALDPQVPIGLGRRFNAFLTANGVNSRLIVIGGAGHAPFVEFPQTFGRILRAGCPPVETGRKTPPH
ncbi:MAG: alpha/beta fold hydrolase [Gammaproteobacteria bacterium]